MAKYIIDVKDGETLYKAVIAPDGEPYITPAVGNVYTEPDLEQVRKGAYRQGYDTGYGTKVNEFYEQGLADAWETARTLWNTPNRKEIFGNTTFNTVLTTLTAQETIEKIRQYEQGKEEIKVGDEVKSIESGWTAIVTKSEEGHLTLMGDSGAIANGYDAKYFAKTGRHFHEIVAVLEKMKEDAT